MSEEEKEAIRKLKHYINITPYWKQEEYTSSEVDHYIKIALNHTDKLQKIIDLMAEDMATDYHSKEWVIQHYLSEVRNGSRRSDKTM